MSYFSEIGIPIDDLKTRVRTGLSLLRTSKLPLHRNEKYAPFFIVGSGRAGTTLLRRILQASNQVHIPPEIWSFQTTYRRFLKYRSVLPWSDLVAVLTRKYISESNFDHSFKANTLYLIEELTDLPDDSRSLASFIDAVNRAHGNHSGASFTRWGDKTPLNSFHLDEIANVFPDARFIHLIRDPADVVYSYLKYDQVAPEVSDIKSGAHRWLKSVQSVSTFAETSSGREQHVIEIHYEKFVHNPEAVWT